MKAKHAWLRFLPMIIKISPALYMLAKTVFFKPEYALHKSGPINI